MAGAVGPLDSTSSIVASQYVGFVVCYLLSKVKGTFWVEQKVSRGLQISGPIECKFPMAGMLDQSMIFLHQDHRTVLCSERNKVSEIRQGAGWSHRKLREVTRVPKQHGIGREKSGQKVDLTANNLQNLLIALQSRNDGS